MPPESVMMDAFLRRDSSFDDVFVTAVQTTGIFCRPSCPARRPLRKNISFYGSPREALLEGFRPCLRCRPLEAGGASPDWLRPLLKELETDPARRWTDREVRALGMSPERVRRWFKKHHGMTFQAYSRARRLGAALGRVRTGERVSKAAFETGYESLSGFQEAFRRYFGDPPTALESCEVAHVDRILTPLGPMLVGCTDNALCLLEFVDRRALPTQVRRIRKGLGVAFVPGPNAWTQKAADQIGEYFAGSRKRFSLPLRRPGTDFQRAVWDALLTIPYGETRSYRDIAADVGREAAVRAVGTANGVNAISIVVPCHRVVGSDGKLTGYGGGLWRKRRLLDLEARPGLG